MSKKNGKELISNRRAYYDYEILDTLEAGIVLSGTEIKSLKNGGGTLQDAYVTVEKKRALLKQASIAPYQFGTTDKHEEKRARILLLHKRELEKIKKKIDQKGVTTIPLSLYLKNGWVKVKIGIAKGKTQYEKRAAIKEKEHKRSIQQALKHDT